MIKMIIIIIIIKIIIMIIMIIVITIIIEIIYHCPNVEVFFLHVYTYACIKFR